MGKGTDALKWVGSKALDGVKAGTGAIDKEISKSVEEQKRKNAVYKEEYEKTLKKEKMNKKLEQDNEIRKRARRDAKNKIKGK